MKYLCKKKGIAEEQEMCLSHTIEELYTAVKRRPKGCEPKNEEGIPPKPPHTIEELYTAVEKNPKGIADGNQDKAPPHNSSKYN